MNDYNTQVANVAGTCSVRLTNYCILKSLIDPVTAAAHAYLTQAGYEVSIRSREGLDLKLPGYTEVEIDTVAHTVERYVAALYEGEELTIKWLIGPGLLALTIKGGPDQPLQDDVENGLRVAVEESGGLQALLERVGVLEPGEITAMKSRMAAAIDEWGDVWGGNYPLAADVEGLVLDRIAEMGGSLPEGR